MPGSTDAPLVSKVRQLPTLAKHLLHELNERIGILSSKRFVAIRTPSKSYSQPTPQGSTGLRFRYYATKKMPRMQCKTVCATHSSTCDRSKGDHLFPHG